MSTSEYGPWNPGLQSEVPQELRQLATIFRPENVFAGIASAVELRGLTGFALSELVSFRPQRLALHELLVRITADFAVPDGTRIEDLGLNFREIARDLLAHSLEPGMPAIVAAYQKSRQNAQGIIKGAVARVNRNWGPEEIAQRRRRCRRCGRGGVQEPGAGDVRVVCHPWGCLGDPGSHRFHGDGFRQQRLRQ